MEQENEKNQMRTVIIDNRSISEVESLLARMQRAGSATGSVTRALIEVKAAHADGEELSFLRKIDSDWLSEAVILLSEQVARDAEKTAQLLGRWDRLNHHAFK